MRIIKFIANIVLFIFGSIMLYGVVKKWITDGKNIWDNIVFTFNSTFSLFIMLWISYKYFNGTLGRWTINLLKDIR